MRKNNRWIAVYPITILMILICVWCGSRAVTTFIENTSIPRSHCIIIDPGHGGIDGGATSCSGISESCYNLEIALRLEDLFHLLGFETKMIRREDISIYVNGKTIAQKKSSDLKERVRIANETPNALYLSIHQNYYPDSRYSGAQVFYPKTANSDNLAETIQNAFRTSLDPTNHREAKKSSGIYLMEHIQCPGVLIECGFLSNPAEEAKLRSNSYQQKLCMVISTAVSSFLSNT